MCRGQQGELMRPPELRARHPAGDHALTDLCNSFLSPALHCQRPAIKTGRISQNERKPLFVGKRNRCPSLLLDGLLLPKKLIKDNSTECAPSYVKGVGQLLGKSKRLVAPLPSPVRVAQAPQDPRRITEA